MAQLNTQGVGTGGTNTGDNLSLPENEQIIGHVEPLIGRVVKHDVMGYFGFPIIRAGQPIAKHHMEKAHSMGRLFELIAATGDE